MSGATRRARVRALAKLNLDLRVLGKRPDGYHELRTIFQTISLADTIELAFTPERRTSIVLEDALGIPDNLVTRAARLAIDLTGATGRVEMRLTKRIPMGAGLGGGSSDAAAVLLALPVLAGRAVDLPKLSAAAAELGSDVPFFLLGGAAVGIGRGTELFPLPDQAPQQGVLVTPHVHVSTAEAYRRLSPGLTTESQQNKMVSFQSLVWERSSAGRRSSSGGGPRGPEGSGVRSRGWAASGLAENDFETVVFEQHPSLAVLKQRLVKAGASTAMMTGSGAALFGLLPTRDAISRAVKLLGDEKTFRISLVSRARYRSLWWRALEEHIKRRVWPPQSRYVR